MSARLLWDKGLAEYVQAARLLHSEARAGDPDPGNPAAVSEAKVREWVERGIVQWLGSCGRHAGTAAQRGHRRLAQLSRGPAEVRETMAVYRELGDA